ncbi:hypothetical protein [Pseudoalteromonas aurantia]|uniref:Uncharacterized protein n=1 Tax=Pseudoalteromonas aurantia 208 TaxID=1314867 RepID=A0ABR9ECS6_9GAMM|nr:hypothetical protein [Pseudoalteromonas aurantia]MBE0368567.1 hypothetical protein [Pseudoalteromonas aurantia 208]
MNNNTTIEIAKNSVPLLLVIYCLAGVFPLLKYTYLNQEPFIFTFKYVGPVILASMLYISLEVIRSQKLFIKVIYIFQILIKAFFITIMTTGYLLLVNDYLSESKEECFIGEIVEKWKNSESLLYTDYNFKVNDSSTNKQYSLNVSKNDYSQHKEGQLFKQCLKDGMLGIRFK